MNQFKPEGVLKKQRRAVAIAIILIVLLLVMLMISLNTGLIRIDPVTVVKTIFGGGDPRDELLLFEFRLPRITIAVLIGMGLAVSGAVLQGIVKNQIGRAHV